MPWSQRPDHAKPPVGGTIPALAMSSGRRSRLLTLQRRLVISLLGIGFLLVWGLPTIIIPLATDQATFALGARTVLDGQQLYNDFWDVKPPLIYLVYALPTAIAGGHVEAVRALDLTNTVVAMLAVFLLARRFFPERAATFAAACYGFAYLAGSGFEGLAQTESFMAAPVALAFAVYRARDDEGDVWRAAFPSGLLLGVAVAFKLSALVFVLGWVAAELLLDDPAKRSLRGAVKRLLLAAAGLFAVQGAWVSYLAATGALLPFVDIQWSYALPYQTYRWAPDDLFYPRFLAHATSDWLRSTAYLAIPAGGAVLIGLYRGPRPGVKFFAFLALLGLLSVYWQGKFFRYHWLIMLPLLAPLAGFAFDQAIELLGRLPKREAVAAFALLAVGFALFASDPLLNTYDSYRLLVERASGTLTQREVENAYLSQLMLTRDVSDYVQGNNTTGEGFYVWGFWPALYLQADRDPPSRFITNAGLRASWTPEAWRLELMEDLTEERPRFIAIAAGDNQPWLVGTTETSAEHFCHSFPELRRFVDENYEPVLSNDLFVLYDRDAPTPRTASAC
jgi:4-amino-4-deoxy-L-arabinose transferase-like glycosyltransferase